MDGTTSEYGRIEIGGGDTAAPLNLGKRLRWLSPYLHRGATRLLDGGCGSGEYVLALTRDFGIDAFGLEYSVEKVQQARKLPALAGRVQAGDLTAIPFPDGHFDVVLLNEVLEHVPDEHAALTEIRRVLRSGGRVVVFSPNRWYPFETHGVILKSTGKKLPPYVPFIPYIPLYIGRRFFHYWARNYWHHELAERLTRAGFIVESRGYVWQTFENISGSQPRWMRHSAALLRRMSSVLERMPLLRRFGVSQVIVASKTTHSLTLDSRSPVEKATSALR